MSSEGSLDEVERLALFLACGAEFPSGRIALLALWADKRKTVRQGYLNRAKRLLQVWTKP